jgi:hypothetical protein
MKHAKCPHEEAIARAARTGNWEASLTTHATTCPICREIMKTSTWMQALGRSSEGSLSLPDASLLWWRAQLSEKRAKAVGSQDVLEWIAFASVAVPSLGLMAWLVWNWYAIQGWIAWILVGAQPGMTGYSASILLSPIITLLSLAAVVLVYPILGEE